MKIDYDKIKSYLNILYECEQPKVNTMEFISLLSLDIDNYEDFNVFWHNLNLINDANYIECIGDYDNNLGISFSSNGTPIISVKNFRLTLIGNQALEAMNSNKIWLKIKDNLKVLGIAGLKQIPSLAIKIIEYKS